MLENYYKMPLAIKAGIKMEGKPIKNSEEKLREKLDQFSFPFQQEAWQGYAQFVNDKQEKDTALPLNPLLRKPKKRRFLWVFFLLLSIAVMATGGWLFFKPSPISERGKNGWRQQLTIGPAKGNAMDSNLSSMVQRQQNTRQPIDAKSDFNLDMRNKVRPNLLNASVYSHRLAQHYTPLFLPPHILPQRILFDEKTVLLTNNEVEFLGPETQTFKPLPLLPLILPNADLSISQDTLLKLAGPESYLKEKRNALALELGGSGGFASLNYERKWGKRWITSFGLGYYQEGPMYYSVPIGFSYLMPLTKKANFITLGVDYSFVRALQIGQNQTEISSFEKRNDLIMPALGFRHENKNQTFWKVRGGPVVNRITPGTFIVTPWLGLAFGRKF